MSSIIIIDDHDIVRAGIKDIAQRVCNKCSIEEASDAEKGLEKIRNAQFNAAIVDISLPDKDGFEVVSSIKQFSPDTKILVFTMHSDKVYAKKILELGAEGFVSKEAITGELEVALKKILNGGRYISKKCAEELLFSDEETSEHEKLSCREIQVLRLMADGNQASSIAEKLNLSVKTINTYRSRIMQKMKISSNAGLISYAIKNNLI